MVETHRQRVLKKFGLPKDTSLSIPEIAHKSGIPAAALQEVYNRGIGAWKTNPESVRLVGSFKKDAAAPRSMKLSKEQWAMARVNSFVDRGKTFKTADADIARKYRVTQ